MSEPSLFLKDYLDKPDFAQALVTLAGDMESKARLPSKVDEIGLVCLDVQKASEDLEKNYGIRPFFLGSGSPTMFRENGIEVPFTTRLGFGFYKGVILELAEPGIGSSVFGQTPVNDKEIKINHLGFKARDMQLNRDNNGIVISYADIMKEIGVSKRVEAELNILGFIGHIHIYETMNLTHHVEIEFLDFRLFSMNGIKISYPPGLLSLIGWWQEKIGPRFLKMKADQPLPPHRYLK